MSRTTARDPGQPRARRPRGAGRGLRQDRENAGAPPTLAGDLVRAAARLKIIQALSEGALSVGDLAVAVESARPATSQHLRVLRDLGLVEGERCGTTIYYRLCTDWQARYLQRVLRTAAEVSA